MSETKSTKCPLPLYHGTSTLFVDSIKEFGLGGKDIIQEGKVLEFARKIFPLVNDNLPKDWVFCAFKDMVEQTPLYQHGQVYLSLSYDYCTYFTLNRKFGSELITYSLKFYENLLAKNIVSPDLLNDYPYLKEVKDLKPEPVVVKIKDVDWDNLLKVDGSALTIEFIEYIQSILEQDDPIVKEGLQRAYRFRFKNPVPSDEIEFDFNPSAKYPENI